MEIVKEAAKKAKTHTAYKNKEGKRIPGVTTITGILAKPALVPWANKLGLKGIEVGKYVDSLAEIGTLAHKMVEARIKNKCVDMREYSQNQIDLAENAFLKFLEWEKVNDFKLIESEMGLISEKYQFGGTCDCYCTLNGKKTLLDFKTSKGIFPEHFTQVSGYKIALEENGYKVEECRILRIGRSEDEGFEDKLIPNIALHEKRFILCKGIYDINKLVNRR